jgi:hypothetical protein
MGPISSLLYADPSAYASKVLDLVCTWYKGFRALWRGASFLAGTEPSYNSMNSCLYSSIVLPISNRLLLPTFALTFTLVYFISALDDLSEAIAQIVKHIFAGSSWSL